MNLNPCMGRWPPLIRERVKNVVKWYTGASEVRASFLLRDVNSAPGTDDVADQYWTTCSPEDRCVRVCL